MLLVMLTAVSGVYVAAWSGFFILLIRHRVESNDDDDADDADAHADAVGK